MTECQQSEDGQNNDACVYAGGVDVADHLTSDLQQLISASHYRAFEDMSS